MTLEVRLLLACAKILTTQEDETAIRQMLDEGIDWTLFAQQAIDKGLASLAGHTLVRVAPDMVPGDILDALRVIIDHTQTKNRELFDELARMIDASPSRGAAFQNACAAANSALAVNPNDADSWRNLGKVLSDLNRGKEAILCFDRAVALAPGNASGWKDYATAMLSGGQTKAALSLSTTRWRSIRKMPMHGPFARAPPHWSVTRKPWRRAIAHSRSAEPCARDVHGYPMPHIRL
jgi:tetratricopeptide (TPR) repeat protein